jgi:hypothetical protein
MATATEVTVIVLALLALIHGLDLIGVTAAAIAFVVGRLMANVYLVPPCRKVLGAPHARATAGRAETPPH